MTIYDTWRLTMKKMIRNLLAVAVATGMILPVTACRKSHEDSKETKETEKSEKADDADDDDKDDADHESDTKKNEPQTLKTNPSRKVTSDIAYFDAQTEELKLEPVAGVEFATQGFTTVSIVGDRILANVKVTLKDEDDADELLKNNYLLFDEGEYYSLQLFDLSGKNLATIPMEENCEFQRAFAMSNGDILIVADKFNYDDCKSTPKFFVITSAGEKVRDIQYDYHETIYSMQAYPLENGNLAIATEGNLFLFDSEGKLIKKISDETISAYMNYSDGKWYVSHMALPTYNISALQELDINTGELKEVYKVNDSVAPDLANNTNCLIFHEGGVSQYNVEKGESTLILSPASAGINFATLKAGQILSDDSMIFISVESDVDPSDPNAQSECYCSLSNKMSIVKLTRSDTNPNNGKAILKLGVYSGSDPYLIEKVMAYNADPSSSAYIEVCTLTNNSVIGWPDEVLIQSLGKSGRDVIEQMHQGTAPDILAGYSNLAEFNNDEYLLDLKPYLESDGNIKKEDYFYNIFSAFEKDGKLFSMPLTFSLRGIAVNGTLANVKEKWTFDDFNKVINSLPADMGVTPQFDSSELLSFCLTASTPEFIDYEKGTSDFVGDKFRALVEMVNKTKKAASKAGSGSNSIGGRFVSEEQQFLLGKVAMLKTRIGTLEDYGNLADENTVFAGYPSADGKGMIAVGETTMSITKCASDPDLAWEFIRYFLNEEPQTALSEASFTLPVNRSAFEKIAEPQIKHSESIYAEYKELPDFFVREPALLTKETNGALATLIETIDNSYQLDGQITSVIVEEANRYFNDWTNLDEACRIIQAKSTDILKSRDH